MGTILIVGRADDLCCRLVGDRLETTGRDFIFLPEDQLFPGLQFVWNLQDAESRGSIGFGRQTIPFDRIDGALARFSGITTSPQDHQTKDGQYLNSEWHALARGYMHSLSCPVINRLRPELWYKSHLSVADLFSMVPDIEFQLPRTMVTTDFEGARAFFEICGGQMRYSPIALPSDYAIRHERDLQKLEPLSKVLPLYLSEYISGDAVRAFVVGQEVVFNGPPEASGAGFCLKAAASLGLTFCEFDLVRTPGGEWYCLGVDCVPHLFDSPEQVRSAVIERLADVLGAGNGKPHA